MNINLSNVLGVTARKALEFKNIEGFTEEESKEFSKMLLKDEEFLEAYRNCLIDEDL